MTDAADIVASLGAQRARIGELKREIDALESGMVPRSRSEAREILDRRIDLLAEEGKRAAKLDVAIWPSENTSELLASFFGANSRRLSEGADLDNVAGFLAFIDEPKVRKRLHRALDDRYAELDLGEGASAADRAEKLRDLRAELRQLERDEFNATNDAIANGLRIAHRDDVPPELLLGLEQ